MNNLSAIGIWNVQQRIRCCSIVKVKLQKADQELVLFFIVPRYFILTPTIRILRLVTTTVIFKEIGDTFVELVPAAKGLFINLFCTMYLFATIGTQVSVHLWAYIPCKQTSCSIQDKAGVYYFPWNSSMGVRSTLIQRASTQRCWLGLCMAPHTTMQTISMILDLEWWLYMNCWLSIIGKT